jgi:hypothetical protein
MRAQIAECFGREKGSGYQGEFDQIDRKETNAVKLADEDSKATQLSGTESFTDGLTYRLTQTTVWSQAALRAVEVEVGPHTARWNPQAPSEMRKTGEWRCLGTTL